MTVKVPGLVVGELLRQDALGDWCQATFGGAACTLRILREELATREEARLLFQEEIRRVSTLDHPAFLRVHRAARGAPRPWLLTEPIDGQNLADHLREEGPLSAEEALALVRTLADGLEFLVGRKQVHVAPVPGRIVRAGSAWRLLTFRDIRAWDELKGLKGKPYPDPSCAPLEHDADHPDKLRPHPFLAWSLGTLLRVTAGGGAPRGPKGQFRPLPEEFPVTLRAAVTKLMHPKPEFRPQGRKAILTTLELGTRPAAAASPDAASAAPASGAAPAFPVKKRKHVASREMPAPKAVTPKAVTPKPQVPEPPAAAKPDPQPAAPPPPVKKRKVVAPAQKPEAREKPAKKPDEGKGAAFPVRKRKHLGGR